jgi:hypothetical protein
VTAVKLACVSLVAGLLASCISSSPATSTVADVAVKPSDLPKGLQKCHGSGEIESFLTAIKDKNSTIYRTTKSDWDGAKKDGAIAAEIVAYADSKARCDVYLDADGTVPDPHSVLVINAVVQFKDERTATNAYAVESFLDLSESDFKETPGIRVARGADTGLTKNSATMSLAFFDVPFYAAFWQNKAFMAAVWAINVDAGQSKKIATNVNQRIDRIKTDSRTQESGASYTKPGPILLTGAVGQAMVLNVATVTVIGANLNAQPPDDAHKPKAGNRLVTVEFKVLYTRTGRRYTLVLLDSSTMKYESGNYSVDPSSSTPVAGDTDRGLYRFEVPQKATGLKVRIQVGDDSATVLLD